MWTGLELRDLEQVHFGNGDPSAIACCLIRKYTKRVLDSDV